MTTMMEETQVQEIAIPSQIPNRIDLTQLPAQVLRSGAVEALANQNEDLMARLGVAQRRAALLENRIQELENEQVALRHQVSVAQDQALVLQEKDRLLTQKTSLHDNEVFETRQQLQLLETQFAELYATSKDRTRAMTNQIEALGQRIERFQRYRRRIRSVAERINAQGHSHMMKWRREEEVSRELKLRLGEAATRIQEMSKNFDANQKQLVESYESTLKNLKDQTQKLENENQAYAEKTKNYHQLFDQTVTLENQLIHEQRQFSEYRLQQEREIATLQIEVSDLRNEQKLRLIEVENLKKSGEEISLERDLLKDQNKKITDQVETLQLLWQDGQNQIEKLQSKNGALQNLNQQLSTNLQQQRHEIQQLRAELDSYHLSTSERMKEIKGQLQLMNPLVTAPEKLSFIEDDSKGVLSRIDTLVAEIQSGFKRQLPEEASVSSSNIDKRGSGETPTP